MWFGFLWCGWCNGVCWNRARYVTVWLDVPVQFYAIVVTNAVYYHVLMKYIKACSCVLFQSKAYQHL